ncbi:MAG: hypothetical protein ACREHD_33130 [Pirellulales bacterium]
MQVSELFRRSILVPADDASRDDLDCEDVSENTRVDIIRIPSDDFFDEVLDMGVFNFVNDRVGSLIGDYETERIAPAQIARVLPELQNVVAYSDRAREFLNDFSRLCRLAMERNMPVYFVL